MAPEGGVNYGYNLFCHCSCFCDFLSVFFSTIIIITMKKYIQIKKTKGREEGRKEGEEE